MFGFLFFFHELFILIVNYLSYLLYFFFFLCPTVTKRGSTVMGGDHFLCA